MNTITAEIITIGDEILFGQITDTNTQWIGAELSAIGVRTIRKSSVGDHKSEILRILAEAEQRADIVIITGGLGPTKDDITKTTLCEYFGTSLAIHEEALVFVTEFFRKRGREITDINKGQAALPLNATYIPNTRGTAPGMWFQERNTIFVSLPGVPHEMIGLMTDEIIPRLKQSFELPVIYHKMIKTIGIGESFLAERIEAWEDALPSHIKLAYLPSMGMVKLRLTATGTNVDVLEKEVQEQVIKVLPLISPYVFGYDSDEFEDVVAELLKKSGQSLSAAESCTGGYLSHLITKIPGCSAYFEGGVVSYSNEAKMHTLGVQEQTLLAHGAVSEETIREMAEGVRKRFQTTFGLATSGIAGPDGGTAEKPVGTVWIALATPQQTITKKLTLGGTREQNIHQSAISLLNVLRKVLLNIPLD
ncbi:competence/damage-inducible protein A [Siphonobacter sp. SORGH_AS_1065]|uniref:competence/damage-inducible protein A n=1 Tax=Siphonobacter sp. SORGH_AS_1065 TaxID=3041795 RepID=UPI0027865113|nr:competence/damage-inducible protein A [Siphonobacter sp. SORGH_AS_1065]MDQ1088951.1 nicotinamide-nucleotide amidase [Siphonobacter sp. SORGH_AS_1065]